MFKTAKNIAKQSVLVDYIITQQPNILGSQINVLLYT